MAQALIVGTVCLNHFFSTNEVNGKPGLYECDLATQLGGGAVHMTRAYQRAAGASPKAAAIVSDDELARVVDAGLELIAADLETVRAAEHTSVSSVVTTGEPNACSVYVYSPPLDHSKALQQVLPLVGKDRWVGVAPFAAEDFAIVESILAQAKERGAKTYLILSTGQVSQPERALALARRATMVQLAGSGAFALSGVSSDIVAAINALREAGVANVVVTSAAGVHACIGRNWHCRPSFRVSHNNVVGADDTFGGTLLAGLANDHSFERTLPLAIAAAAMHVEGIERRGGWDELRQFAATTPKNPYAGLVRTRPDGESKPLLRPQTVAAAVVGTLAGLIAWWMIGFVPVEMLTRAIFNRG